MSDKLVSLESVLKEIRRFKGYIDDDMIERFSIAFKRLPAVPHEMSAREYEKAIDQAFHSADDAYGEWADAIDEGNKDKAIAIIEKWVREHPERSEE